MVDFLTFALPFVFVFAVAYGALEVSGVFSREKVEGNQKIKVPNRRVNGLISLVLAFFAVTSDTVTNFIFQILPYATVLFVVVFFVAFLFAPFKKKEGEKRDYYLIIMVAALLIIFMITSPCPGLESAIIAGSAMGTANPSGGRAFFAPACGKTGLALSNRSLRRRIDVVEIHTTKVVHFQAMKDRIPRHRGQVFS